MRPTTHNKGAHTHTHARVHTHTHTCTHKFTTPKHTLPHTRTNFSLHVVQKETDPNVTAGGKHSVEHVAHGRSKGVTAALKFEISKEIYKQNISTV
jgi:hypothetical protein